MRNKTPVVVGVIALAAAAWSVGVVGHSNACSKQVLTTKASVTTIGCPVECGKAVAAVTANARKCSRATAASLRAACNKASATTAGAWSCFRAVGAAKTESCCSKGATARTAGTSTCPKSARTAGTYACSKSSATTARFASLPYHDSERVVLTGKTVCGRCNLNLTVACQVVFQSADGKFYRLLKSARVDALRGAKSDAGFKIVTRVRKLDGVKYLDLEKFDSL